MFMIAAQCLMTAAMPTSSKEQLVDTDSGVFYKPALGRHKDHAKIGRLTSRQMRQFCSAWYVHSGALARVVTTEEYPNPCRTIVGGPL